MEVQTAYGDETAEFGLPAVIGVGEQKFNEIVTAMFSKLTAQVN